MTAKTRAPAARLLLIPLITCALAACANKVDEVEGPLDLLPPERIGTWTIKGSPVLVTRETRLDETHCPFKQGGWADAEGTLKDGVLHAKEIECETLTTD